MRRGGNIHLRGEERGGALDACTTASKNAEASSRPPGEHDGRPAIQPVLATWKPCPLASDYPAREGTRPPAPAGTARTPRGSYFRRTSSSCWRVDLDQAWATSSAGSGSPTKLMLPSSAKEGARSC